MVVAVGCAVTSDPSAGGAVAEPVRVRRPTDQEGQKLQQTVRRGSTNSVRYRRAMMLLASAGGNRVPVIAQLVQADEDTVRETSSSRRPPPAPPSSANPSPAGRCASSPPRQHPGRAQADPRRPTRRRPDLHHPGRPLRPHRRGHPPLGEEEQGRAVPHPDLRFLGQPDRGPLRPAAPVHPGQLPPPQPPCANPGTAPPPALAQHQRPPPRRTRRPTRGTRPHRSEKGIRWAGRPLNTAA